VKNCELDSNGSISSNGFGTSTSSSAQSTSASPAIETGARCPVMKSDSSTITPYLTIASAVEQERDSNEASSATSFERDRITQSPSSSSASARYTSSDSSAGSLPYREIVYEDLKFTSLVPIGRGAFGVVFKAEWRGAVVAVKKLSMLIDDEQTAQLRSECALMNKCGHHPNVIRFVG
jgi:hypothetical protein